MPSRSTFALMRELAERPSTFWPDEERFHSRNRLKVERAMAQAQAQAAVHATEYVKRLIDIIQQRERQQTRNLLAMSQQLDHWSMLGVPLVVSVVSPSSDSEDASAQGPGRPVPGTDAVPISPESQQDWTLRHVPLMLAKNCVQAVIWNQLTDESPHEFPHGGLIDHRGIPKPAFESFRKIRQEYL